MNKRDAAGVETPAGADLLHPSFLYYGETVARSFPLILVIGREPQVDKPVSPGAGTYDFRGSPRCGFWNSAAGLAARYSGVPGMTTAAIKRVFHAAQAAPLVFADALPIGLSDKIPPRDKARLRRAVPKAAIDRHLAHVLCLEDRPDAQVRSLMDRVEFVILSGHAAPGFEYASGMLVRHLEGLGVPFVRTAFLFGSNMPGILSALAASGWDTRFRSVMRRFRAADRNFPA
ncbi:hypothetical protein GGR34_001592 [Microvirga flocculans]|uniref:Uracil-DNA glycosylase-like domain-containing protein n=1 Tax=Microvirga flocculans TaxID=217168 RepID=A0A7W6N7X5_9HYPH|nr:hypothetical protein [Microvirga flocculans]MBB4039945.1 hypothetical protein [Microvirga flocculans]